MVLMVVATALAALVHVYIFVIESLRFLTPSTMKTFGIRDRAEAEIMRPWAFNQGFYNLFLAVVAGAGALLIGLGPADSPRELVGRTLVVAGTASMLGAAVVLVLSDRSKVRAAAVQGLFPIVALLAFAVTAAA